MANGGGHQRPSLLVFSDDWGRHPSSCQHLVRQLLPRYQVTWVNTIGMRRPTLNVATFRRAVEKVGHWSSRADASEFLPDNLEVVSPTMWPWFSRGYDRGINKRLLTRSIRPRIESMPEPVIVVTTIPIVADLIGELPVARWVYYCVDDFGEWPGLDQSAMRLMEARLIEKVDVIIAASDNLRERIATMGRQSELLTHGVDLEHWQVAGDTKPLTALGDYERPLVVFWGVIDRRMDVNFVETLANEMSRGAILLVGPTDDPDPALFRLSRVVHLPPMAYAKLPRLAAEASVLIMPYRDLPVTRAMQPLKLKEYLATGKPTVVRDLPATRPWVDSLDLASTPAEFSACVRHRLSEGLADSQLQSRQRLANESWEAKAEAFEQLAILPTQRAAAAAAETQ
ncbi:MAG: glycosyltransferase family protein [Pirellulaceae bacterium]